MTEGFTIERDGQKYDVAVMVDDSPANPREDYDHSATEFYITGYTYSRWDTYVDELTGDAGGNALKHFIAPHQYSDYRASKEDVERRFAKWAAITGSPKVLVIGSDHGYSQSDWHDWYALVDTDVMKREGYGGKPEEVAKAEADEYAAYAYGDVYGVRVTSEHGDEESLWGIVDRNHYGDGIGYDGKQSYVRETAEELVDELEAVQQQRMAERIEAANRVGAGFVGVI